MSKGNGDENRLSNKKIKEDVCDALAQGPIVNCSDIKVSVDNGVVTLKGMVDERQMKRLAEEWVEYVAGVNEVQNELQVDSNKVNKKNKEQNL